MNAIYPTDTRLLADFFKWASSATQVRDGKLFYISDSEEITVDELAFMFLDSDNNPFPKGQHRISEWKSIETAPKDGTFILMADHKGEVHKAAWQPYPNLAKPGAPDWCIADTYGDEQGGCYTVDFPTHWMPLPTIEVQAKQ